MEQEAGGATSWGRGGSAGLVAALDCRWPVGIIWGPTCVHREARRVPSLGMCVLLAVRPPPHLGLGFPGFPHPPTPQEAFGFWRASPRAGLWTGGSSCAGGPAGLSSPWA